MQDKICRMCSRSFQNNNGRAAYCSPNCKVQSFKTNPIIRSLPKYFNCRVCEVAIPILKENVAAIETFGVPSSVTCGKCSDKQDLILNDNRI